MSAVFANPLFYLHDVLGYRKLTQTNVDWINWGIETRRGMFLGPPQHYKSTSLTVALPILMLLANPDEVIFIGSKTLPKAASFVRTIRDTIRDTPGLRDILWDGKAQHSDTEFTVKRGVKRHDPSVRAIAPGASLVQAHASRAILDDVVGQEDFESAAAREATVRWFKQSFLRAMTQDSQILVVGQRWHEHDLYGEIESKAVELGFSIKIAAAIKDGKALAPDIMDLPRLEAMRAALGNPLFELQWNQNATLLAGEFFRWEQFPQYDMHPPLDEMDIYQGIDLAISKKTTADFTVVVTLGFHRASGRLYLLHVKRGHWGFIEGLANVEIEAEAWRPLRRRCESNAYQIAFVEVSKPSRWPISGVSHGTDKVSRAQRMRALVEAGKFFVPNPEKVDWAREFVKECCAFPVKEGQGHDDQVDAAVDACELIAEGGRAQSGVTANPTPAFSRPGGLSGFDRLRSRLGAGWRRR